MKRMVRAKVGNKSHVANLKRKGIDPASRGLTEEGEPLPKPAAIDLSAGDADEDAEGGVRHKTQKRSQLMVILTSAMMNPKVFQRTR